MADERVAFCAHKIGYAELLRQITAARLRFDPDAAERARHEEAEGRCFDIHKNAVSPAGTVPVSGVLDLPDALDLDDALRNRAAELKDLGSTESLNVRRAQALGDLARGQGTLDYDQKSRRPIELHLHSDHVGRCDNTRSPVLAETIREWCANPGAAIIVKPVIDLAEHIHVAAYEVPDRLPTTLTTPHPATHTTGGATVEPCPTVVCRAGALGGVVLRPELAQHLHELVGVDH